MKNTKNMVILGAIVAVGVAFAAWKGLIPPKSGVEGTIGAANRYQEQQISDQDVKLSDPQVQAFLQSDLFHQIQTNESLRTAVKNGDLMAAVTNVDGLASAVTQVDGFQTFLSDKRAITALKEENLTIALKSVDEIIYQGPKKHPVPEEFLKVLDGPGFDNLRKEYKLDWNQVRLELAHIAANSDARKVMLSAELAKAVNIDGFASAIGQDQLVQALGDDGFRKLVKLDPVDFAKVIDAPAE